MRRLASAFAPSRFAAPANGFGDMVIVAGTKAKNGKPLANARSVVMASTGKKLGAGSSEGVTP